MPIVAGLRFLTKTAGEIDLLQHLNECNNNFTPPLETKTNIQEYSKKLYKSAITFEAWSDNILAGLVAAYFNDKDRVTGFISNVSVVKNYEGKGIASALLKQCINYAKQERFAEIKLEVSKRAKTAKHLYVKYGFVEIETNHDTIVMKLELQGLEQL